MALAAAGAVVAITLATRDHPGEPAPAGRQAAAGQCARPGGAAIRQAFVQWPKGSLDTLVRLGQDYPKSPIVQLYLGPGLLLRRLRPRSRDGTRPGDEERDRHDTPWEVAAENVLHPQFFTDNPVFTPATERAAVGGPQLQAQGHQHSAERLYLEAARRAPNDDQAKVAAAVGRFDKDDITPSFSHLGPLTQRFPKSQVVRYYLGLLLAWTAQGRGAVAQFQRVVSLGPSTALGRSAQAFIDRVRASGTGSAKK